MNDKFFINILRVTLCSKSLSGKVFFIAEQTEINGVVNK